MQTILKIEKRAGKWCAVTSSGLSMYSNSRKVFVTEWAVLNFPVIVEEVK